MKLVPRYTDIADNFAIEDQPSSVAAPQLLLWNASLAKQFNIEIEPQLRASTFAGNEPQQIKTVALGYSGHQFGHFSPRLGDGRAHLLGAINDDKNQLWDIQLKGSGATPYSRGGDGKCALGPAIREYVMSEAMHALGIPTTRCLAVVGTGESVSRNPPQPGAVVTRLASSHIRVGSFQYLATQGDIEGLKKLADLAIGRHYPEIKSEGPERYLAFLESVTNNQVSLIINWMRVGFIHGVMNTDNTLVSGETIDYGPCAMMDNFDFDTVFSSIDKQGRYAFGNQPNMASWNCARLAESLIPLISDDEEKAVSLLTPVIHRFSEQFNTQFTVMWSKKLGLVDANEGDKELVSELLTLLQTHHLDYTNTFDALTEFVNGNATFPEELTEWANKWQSRISNDSYKIMRAANPRIIPRNHIIETILAEYNELGSSKLMSRFIKVANNPYLFSDDMTEFQKVPLNDTNYKTFCGT
ncbi:MULTISPECIES: protein adenylyltransferase SelO family protein [unclassified Pseudoalteromonas]|uniref:protein adenylyltransferase SelO n=1 Tax=unclassified Pseudoalteromonas TaxID=194690 RepID=UPI0011091172|nr:MULTISPECIES: YdiU family protein [unclassified Pseudoalteromonas]TMN83693.1 YdiU family protein [Pseudoalteromonas sp. S410]TMN91631.1 YdiU family protein [Pseudoalteromonas sp. S408]TMN96041.1 YdiU family protein [Pseudoalteromonas sp. S407]TMO02622.1 YdiU family protein [Pseudoalteromonas sp. S409]TMO12848.1 YdiU family protein [Pseudoalteromonas sp. S186]